MQTTSSTFADDILIRKPLLNATSKSSGSGDVDMYSILQDTTDNETVDEAIAQATKMCYMIGTTVSWKNGDFQNAVVRMLNHLIRVKNRHPSIDTESIGKMLPHEVSPTINMKATMMSKKLDGHAVDVSRVANTTKYPCEVCGSTLCHAQPFQNRGADEGASIRAECLECGATRTYS